MFCVYGTAAGAEVYKKKNTQICTLSKSGFSVQIRIFLSKSGPVRFTHMVENWLFFLASGSRYFPLIPSEEQKLDNLILNPIVPAVFSHKNDEVPLCVVFVANSRSGSNSGRPSHPISSPYPIPSHPSPHRKKNQNCHQPPIHGDASVEIHDPAVPPRIIMVC